MPAVELSPQPVTPLMRYIQIYQALGLILYNRKCLGIGGTTVPSFRDINDEGLAPQGKWP
jgi:hypothetical protein